MTTADRARAVWSAMIRRKAMDRDLMATPLQRCLTTLDLVLLGIGNMCGAGIYVLTGTVVRHKAGPATFLSYLIAGVTAFLNGLCYAELGARVPKAGSAYSYTYIAAGEFLGFVIGWSIILEYVLSAASIARGFSGTVNALSNNGLANWSIEHVGTFYTPQPNTTESSYMISRYPDLLSFGAVLLVGLLLCLGASTSKHFNTLTTSINLVILAFTTCVLLHFAQLAYWTNDNFLPFEFTGVLSGAATCFYAFIGFDAVSISTEEALTPQKSLPIATGVSVTVVTVMLVMASAALTLFEPWQQINTQAAFTAALGGRHLYWAEVITGVGSIAGIISALYCNNYAMPRVIYAMASDGLIFRQLAYVWPRTRAPVLAIMSASVLAALLALILDIEALADFLSIGTLIAYTIVSCNVIVLRYRRPAMVDSPEEDSAASEAADPVGSLKPQFAALPVLRTLAPGQGPLLGLAVLVSGVISACLVANLATGQLISGSWWPILLLLLFILQAAVGCMVILVHQQDQHFETFRAPGVPVLPCFVIALNVTLIMKLQVLTWIRFFVWLGAGLLVYFGYGIRHSGQCAVVQTTTEVTPLSTDLNYKKLVGSESAVGGSIGESTTTLTEGHNEKTMKNEK